MLEQPVNGPKFHKKVALNMWLGRTFWLDLINKMQGSLSMLVNFLALLHEAQLS